MRALGLALLALIGCGRPVVGVLPEVQHPECQPVGLTCRLGAARPLDELPLAAFDAPSLEECLSFTEDPCRGPDGSLDARCVDRREQTCAADDLGGASPTDLFGCERSGVVRVEGTMRLESTSIACADLRFDLGVGAVLEIANAQLSGVRLDVRGERDSVVRLASVSGVDVEVDLGGSAWLEVVADSSLSRLRVDASEAAEGRVVAIEGSSVSDSGVRTGARGELFLANGSFTGGAIDVGRFVSEEGALEGTRMRALDLVIAATSLRNLQAEIAYGTIVSGTSDGLEVFGCSALRLVNATATHSYFDGCSDGLELDGANIDGSVVRGAVRTTSGAISTSVLAPGGAPILLEGTSMRSSLFCDATDLTANGGALICLACTPDIPFVDIMNAAVDAPECPSIDLAVPEGSGRTR